LFVHRQCRVFLLLLSIGVSWYGKIRHKEQKSEEVFSAGVVGILGLRGILAAALNAQGSRGWLDYLVLYKVLALFFYSGR
jgi:hypothetical protein